MSFASLPPEIRLAIWDLCIPRCLRTTNESLLTIQQSNQVKHHVPGVCGPPQIARVCREARKVALKDGRYYDNITDFHKGRTWINCPRDIIYIDGLFKPSLATHRNHVMSVAAAAPAVALYIPWHRRRPGRAFHSGFLINDHLAHLIVCEDQFKVEMTYEQAIELGIFGLWAENRFAMVKPGEVQMLDKLANFQPVYQKTNFQNGLSQHLLGEAPALAACSSTVRTRAVRNMVEDLWLQCFMMDNKDADGKMDESPLIIAPGGVLEGFRREHTWVRETLKAMPKIELVLVFQLLVC
ncbi:hypothetical protein VFPPC_02369 [Pochonia chlamydosporia 170]|uniref:2EXR domain-containing protein n=1 Tax=Pochonia chlamydosporia 170 TaxID=1380566 RepID=A0A179FWP4_METCM|nr:hypothetical protein VFPPC_02369 [Pochonia chlamydosporia 170]OAQ69787.1 hypothetical protein VFPPC_02369 [Pochonia chlamydosporia 170]